MNLLTWSLAQSSRLEHDSRGAPSRDLIRCPCIVTEVYRYDIRTIMGLKQRKFPRLCLWICTHRPCKQRLEICASEERKWGYGNKWHNHTLRMDSSRLAQQLSQELPLGETKKCWTTWKTMWGQSFRRNRPIVANLEVDDFDDADEDCRFALAASQ